MKIENKNDVRKLFEFYYNGIFKLHQQEKNIDTCSGGALYSSSDAEMEAALRPLWGLVPYICGGGSEKDLNFYVNYIKQGIDKKSPRYWGKMKDYDQKMVEITVVAMSLLFLKNKILHMFNGDEKKQLFEWLQQINKCKCFETNWIFFPLLVNISLKKCGAEFSQPVINKCIDVIDNCYLGNGWYADGKGNQSDYYIAFAMHFYSLLYVKFMNSDDPERSKVFKDRASLFALQYIYWFSDDGSSVPYGRSLIYRFAQISFWEALVFADVDVLDIGIIKGIIFRNLKWWTERNIMTDGGLLSLGYTYPNTIMTEGYNAAGSPYWSFKGFLILTLPDNHNFWLTDEKDMPNMKNIMVEKEANITLCRDGKHVFALCNGQNAPNGILNFQAKYWKFAYSNLFGFSVPRGAYGLTQGAFDSMFVVSDDKKRYIERSDVKKSHIKGNIMYTSWSPLKNVLINHWLIPLPPWHIRICEISTDRSISVADGGFAICSENNMNLLSNDDIKKYDNYILIKNGQNYSGILNLYGYSNINLIKSAANTNIMFSRAFIPTLTANIDGGKHTLISAVYGDCDPDKIYYPEIKIYNDKYEFYYLHKKIYTHKIND